MIRLTTITAPTTTVQQYTYEIVEKLCKPYCTNSSFTPAVTRTWSVANSETVGSLTYFTIQCVTTVTYLPKGACKTCGQKTNTFIETFETAFSGGTSIAFTDANAYTEPAYTKGCGNAAQGIRNVGSITLTAS